MTLDKSKIDPEDISKIIKENNITIPAGMLYIFLQLTELSSTRGSIRANELTLFGNVYNNASKMLDDLIEEKYKEKNNKEEKKKKKKLLKEINTNK